MKELLFSVTKKDLIIETFRCGGKGGQHQNKTDSGVRIRHPASGAVFESRNHREQPQNKREAFRKLVSCKKFKSWLMIKASGLMSGETIEQKVEKQMNEKNLKIEYIKA